eukprot:Ihof_evm5s302 gene=Ihof_evmTU5s302
MKNIVSTTSFMALSLAIIQNGINVNYVADAMAIPKGLQVHHRVSRAVPAPF